MKVRNGLAIASGALGLMLASSVSMAAQSVTLDIALPHLAEVRLYQALLTAQP